MFVAYRVINMINGKSYIGITTRGLRKRWDNHVSCAKNKETPLYRAMRKHGVSNFCISAIASALSHKDLIELEQVLIKQEGTHISGGVGYNVTLGGDGTLGWVPSDVTRSRMAEKSHQAMKDPARRAMLSESAKKQWQDPVARALFIEKMKLRTVSPESRALISMAMRGRIVSEKTRAIIRERLLGKPRPDSVKEKIRIAHTGMKHSSDARAKMSASRKGKPKSEAWKAAARAAWVIRRARGDVPFMPRSSSKQ